jgi:restriction endonuclease Mrr
LCRQGAQSFAKKLPLRMELIDGRRLAMLTIEHDVGVAVTSTYRIKKVTSDCFTDEHPYRVPPTAAQ